MIRLPTVPPPIHGCHGYSSYRRQRRPQIPQPQPHPPTQPNNELCSYCGTKEHGKSAPTKVRRKDCPTFGTRCDSCDREHHFGKMCRSRGDNRAVRGQQESALFDTLSTKPHVNIPTRLTTIPIVNQRYHGRERNLSPSRS